MLPFNFDYYKPTSIHEAVELYQRLEVERKQPMIFSGGTELITLGRIDLAYTEAVIDIKDIAECRIHEMGRDHLLLGGCLTLTEIEERNLFPLLTKTAAEVADHTARGKITLGGNVCAQIFYREAVLPLLLADSTIVLAGPSGIRSLPINSVFQGNLRLNKGEFLVQTATEPRFITAPYYHVKRRQQWETGYPLITIAALKLNQEIRLAVSGLCPFPFRSQEMEAALNRAGQSAEARVVAALDAVPKPVLEDVEGSAEYRMFVLRNLLSDALAALDGVRV